MRRTPFNDGWTVGAKANSFMEMIAGSGSEPARVTLPHDAMIDTERSRRAVLAAQWRDAWSRVPTKKLS